MNNTLKTKFHARFRLSAGRIHGISLGHLFRCLNLANRLSRDNNIHIEFYITGDHATSQIISKSGYEVFFFKTEIEANNSFASKSDYEKQAWIIDLPNPEKDLVAMLKNRSNQTMFISDVTDIDCFPGYTLNPSTQEPSSNSYQNPKLLSGHEYAVFDEHFARISRDRSYNKHMQIVASFGGSDPSSTTLRFAKALKSISLPGKLTLIIGPSNLDTTRIQKTLDVQANPFTIVSNPESIVPIFERADLAILAGGITSIEAASNGLPSILLPTASWENERALELSNLGCSEFIDSAWKLDEKSLSEQLNRILNRIEKEPQRITRMSQKGRESFDGKGTQRVADFIKCVLLSK